MIIVTIFRWILHWFGQGLKLWLFVVIASLFTIPIYLLLEVLEGGSNSFDELSLVFKTGIVLGYIVCYTVGIAVFTAVLATQLKDNPLQSFSLLSKPDSNDNDTIK